MSSYVAMPNDERAATVRVPKRDPFYVVKDKVQTQKGELDSLRAQWRDLLENTNTAINDNFSQTTTKIRHVLKIVRADIKDLAKTIEIVETHRARFKSIDDVELASRNKFVNEIRAHLDVVELDLDSDRTKRKLDKDAREALLEGSRKKKMDSAGRQVVQNEQQVQQRLREEQDEVFDDMISALKRLEETSTNIGTELNTHKELLGDMDQGLDQAGDNMTIVLRKMDRLLKKKDRFSWCCLISLAATAIVLLFIIIYT